LRAEDVVAGVGIGLSTLDSMGLPNPGLILLWGLLVLRLFTGGLGLYEGQ